MSYYESGLSSLRFPVLFPYNIHDNTSCYARIYPYISQAFCFVHGSAPKACVHFFFAHVSATYFAYIILLDLKTEILFDKEYKL